MTRGLVLGKFFPFHLGHKYLIDFARQHVDKLDVVVGTMPTESISGESRFQAVRQTYQGDPGIWVRHLDKVLPQAPRDENDHEFWETWKRELLIAPWAMRHYDYVFTSEEYGWKLAEVIGAKHIPVNIARSIIPISGTHIRETLYFPQRPGRPFAWDFLAPASKPDLVKIITIGGAESTGKSTLSRSFATRHGWSYVPEYGRDYYEMRNLGINDVRYEHLDEIAIGHMASVHAAKQAARQFLLVDTDPFVTALYSKIYFGKVSDVVKQAMEKWTSDIFVVTDPSVPHEADGLRNLPDTREEFTQEYKELLTQYGHTFTQLHGDQTMYYQGMSNALENHLENYHA